MIVCIQNDENGLVSRTHKMSGTCENEKHWEREVLADIANYLVYTSEEKIDDFFEFINKQHKNMIVQICKEEKWYPYNINEKLLMKIYNKKYDEYHIVSEYEITDWAISSSEDEPSDWGISSNDDSGSDDGIAV
jgi:hypothetical protein